MREAVLFATFSAASFDGPAKNLRLFDHYFGGLIAAGAAYPARARIR
jgi:hypothetical protein